MSFVTISFIYTINYRLVLCIISMCVFGWGKGAHVCLLRIDFRANAYAETFSKQRISLFSVYFCLSRMVWPFALGTVEHFYINWTSIPAWT